MLERNEELPLAGINVLITRAVKQSARLVEDLTSRGAEVTVIPAVSIFPVEEPEGFARAMAMAGLYENVIFTSVNGVKLTHQLLESEKMGPWDLPPALCVGEKTADAWEEMGGEVAAVPERYTAEALLDTLSDDLAGYNFLIMRPEVVRTDLGRTLRERGADVDEIILYRTVQPGSGATALGELIKAGKPDVVFFASPSAVEGTVKMAVPGTQYPVPSAENQGDHPGPWNLEHGLLDIPAICIGPTTARAAEEAGFKEVYFPDEHTVEGMVEELMVISAKLK